MEETEDPHTGADLLLLFEGMGLVIKAKTIYIILIESNRNHALRASTKERLTNEQDISSIFQR